MKKTKWLYLVLSILWAGFIFWNSSQNAEVSSALSDGVINIFGLTVSEFWVRKSAHFCAFALLGVLIELFFAADRSVRQIPICTILLVCLLTACIDETIQLFPVGRSSELRDVWIDFSGSLTGTLALWGLHKVTSVIRTRF